MFFQKKPLAIRQLAFLIFMIK